ncbi:YML083C domain-containing protein [Allorhodopirellula solitaria]|uniref:Uncharacterized protein n=1 Tax=Allorhodopirellula solitaria TaxID=2527987 RepID=A0A5C5XR84_9BACT|nr:hypothetical protein [Allorhodopirellula solitaria]TWT65021.1 hypothetical protein CA85_33660 [Allorhodopirellula solitaria]
MIRYSAWACPWLIVACLLFLASPLAADGQATAPNAVPGAGDTGAGDVGEASATSVEPDDELEEEAAKTGEGSREESQEASTDEADSSAPAKPTEAAGSRSAKLSRPPSPLAVPQWRGYTPRWIGLYGSQLADLIPESFRPISIDDLVKALRDSSHHLQPPSEVPIPRLTVVAHTHSDHLVSDASRLVLPKATQRNAVSEEDETHPAWQRYRLGAMNLDLAPSSTAATTRADRLSQARIVSDPEGNSFAWGPPEAAIDFEWSVRCQRTIDGRQWTLQLPDATVTQFYLSVAKGTSLIVEGGAATRLTEAPPWEELGLHPDSLERSQARYSADHDSLIWYSIEPTPGQPLVIRQRATDGSGSVSPWMSVVRGCHLQARWMGDQLRWTYRITFDSSSSHDLTELAWADGEVTAVQCDSLSVPFVWHGNIARWGDFHPGNGSTDDAAADAVGTTTTTWVVEGVSRRQGDRVSLPRPLLPPDHFVVPPQAWHMQLDIPHWSMLSEVRLPRGWSVRRLPTEASRPVRLSSLAADGSEEQDLTNDVSITTWMATGPAPQADAPWSVSLVANDSLVFADHQMRFEMDESSIQARGKISVEMPRGAISPVTLELQDGFQFELIGVGEGRRSVPVGTGTGTGTGRRLTIWPGNDEVIDNRVVVYVSGRSRRSNIANRMPAAGTTGTPNDEQSLAEAPKTDEEVEETVRATAEQPDPTAQDSPRGNRAAALSDQWLQQTEPLWLMRAVDCPGQLLATIVPPAGMTWSAKASIEPSRIAFPDLSATQRRFFAPLPGDAIVFGGPIDATPEVTLEKPDVYLSASLRTLLHAGPKATPTWRSPSQRRLSSPGSQEPASLWQTVEVKTEGTAGEIRSMRLRFAARSPERGSLSSERSTTGAPEDAPAESSPTGAATPPWQSLQWYVQLQPGQAETPLAQHAVTRHFVENSGDWEVQIALPPQFTNQSLLLGRRRLRAETGRKFAIGLPNVPDAASQSAEIWIDSSLQLHRHPETLKGVPMVDSSFHDRTGTDATASRDGGRDSSFTTTTRYRYSPNDQPWVEVRPRAHPTPLGLIVGEHLTAEASVSGTDTLRLTCLARSRTEMLLTFPPSLHLVDLRCDGVLITPRVIPGYGVVIPTPATVAAAKSPSADSLARTPGSSRSEPRRSDAEESESLQTSSAPRWVRIEANWVSETPLNRWYRWYQFPLIELDQLAVDRRNQLLASTGTRAFHLPGFARPWYPAASPLLLPTGLVTGIGWVAAFLLLALACLVGRRSLRVVVAGILLTAVAVALWPAAAMALLTFVALPLTLAAIQLTTAVWHRDDEGGRKDSEARAAQSLKDPSESRLSGVSPLVGWIVFALTFAGSAATTNRLAGQSVEATATSELSSAGRVVNDSEDDKSAPTIDVLVPLQGDGEILGNKIYIPESFYNDLFFRSDRLSWQNPMIDRVSYELHLKSPLENSRSILGAGDFFESNGFENRSLNQSQQPDSSTDDAIVSDEILSQSGAAKLQARLKLTLPPNIRRIRLPYRFDQIDNVMQVNTIGVPVTIRWGGERDGWAWVEIPMLGRDPEIMELTISLNCELQWQDPWVRVACDLPSLPAADLVVRANDAVENVMLLTPTTSWFVDWESQREDESSPPTDPLGSVRTIDEGGERQSTVMLLGSQRQLSLRFQIPSSARASVEELRVPAENAGDEGTRNLASRDVPRLPWQDASQWQQRFWIHSESGKTVIECELECLQTLPPEVVVAITTSAPAVLAIDAKGNRAEWRPTESQLARGPVDSCDVVGTQWTCLSRDTSSTASSQTVRFMSLTTPARPIRLAWTLATPQHGAWQIGMPKIAMEPGHRLDGGAPEQSPAAGSEAVSPEEDTVSSMSAAEPDERNATSFPAPWVAWTFADDVQPDWSTMSELEPLPVEQFYASWTGYLSTVDRAAVGRVGQWILRQRDAPQWEVSTRHDISVQNDTQHVRFSVQVNDPENVSRGRVVAAKVMSSTPSSTVGSSRYRVRLPQRAELLDWSYEAEGESPISPRTFLSKALSRATDGGDDDGLSTTTDGDPESDVPPADVALPPWTVSRIDGVTTLYLTSDQSSFQISVDAIVPHRGGSDPNELGLMTISKIASDTFQAASENAGPQADRQASEIRAAASRQQSHELQITRHVDTVVNWVHAVPSPRMDSGVSDAASLLADGEILVDRFQADGSVLDAFAAARFRTGKNDQPFDMDSRITLRWEEGRWTAQTDCLITSDYCPDYVDIALPTRWCESLRIEPHCVSSRQPTLDPAMQVLRLQLRRGPAGRSTGGSQSPPAGGDSQAEKSASDPAGGSSFEYTRAFRLVSRLAVSEVTRVSVPELRVMDADRHRIDVVVPTRLTNEQVRWRSNFAGPIEKPRWRIQPLPDTDSAASKKANEQASDAELSVYAVTSPRWSIDLETLPRTDRIARLLHADHCVLARPTDENLLLVSRFDVLPGDQPSLRLAVDSAVELQGVWAASRQADLRRVSSDSEDAESGAGDREVSLWEVSLPLSRLSQTVEVLVSVRRDSRDVLLPSLVGLSSDAARASVNWCQLPTTSTLSDRSIDQIIGGDRGHPSSVVVFHNDPQATALISSPLDPDKRIAWLASNVVKAIGATSDSLADRRDDEVAVWLKPWIARYQMLCQSAGRQIGDPDPPSREDTGPSESQTAGGIPPGDLLSWEEMDDFIVTQESRYFPDDSFISGDASATWSDYLAITKPPGYTDRWTFTWSKPRLPIQALAAQRLPVSEQTRQLVLRSGLFFIVASLLMIVALFPRRKPAQTADRNAKTPTTWRSVTLNPSLWLVVLSIIGLVLIPLPMALGLLAVALVLSASHTKHWIASQWNLSSRKNSQS